MSDKTEQDLKRLMMEFERDGLATGCINPQDVHKHPGGGCYVLSLVQRMFTLYCVAYATGGAHLLKIFNETVHRKQDDKENQEQQH